MPVWLLPLLELVVPYIAQLIMALIQAFSKNPTVSNPTFVGTIQEIVSGISRSHPTLLDSEKRQMASDAIDQYCTDNKWDIMKTHEKNLLMELAVNKYKVDNAGVS
jgi:hypothetical protein